MNPFKIIEDIAVEIAAAREVRDEERIRNSRTKRILKKIEKAKKADEEYRRWIIATEEAKRNPEEWQVLPYRWSPFGIFI